MLMIDLRRGKLVDDDDHDDDDDDDCRQLFFLVNFAAVM